MQMVTVQDKTFHIKTYGCQANLADSEKMGGILEALGYKELLVPVFKTEKEEFKYILSHADLFIINSCAVRQKSEDKVYGIGKPVKEVLEKNSRKPLIVLAGCVAGSAMGERKRTQLEKLKKKAPWVDLYLSPSEINSLPGLLNSKNINGGKVDLKLADPKHAYVNVSYGCDNYCSYCVVPYSRGKEVSRSEQEIMGEITRLVEREVREITLCGQNVNSWGLSPEEKLRVRVGTDQKLPFASLLRKIHQIEGLEKIDFISSNPFDFTDDLIEVIKLPKVANYIHIAAQSGNNDILKAMNRKHTVEEFEKLVEKIRIARPGIEIGTDAIVGFPGETREQFMDTVKLFKKMKFNVAFIAMYSPRKGTTAEMSLKDNVPAKEKKWRHAYLTKVWKDSQKKSS